MPSNKEFLALPVPKPQHITLLADWQLSWLLSPLRRNVPILNHSPPILIFLSLPPPHKRSRQQLQFSCSACAGCGHEISTQVNRFSQKTQQHFQSISQTHTTISHCAFVLLPPRKMILSISPHAHKKRGEKKKEKKSQWQILFGCMRLFLPTFLPLCSGSQSVVYSRKLSLTVALWLSEEAILTECNFHKIRQSIPSFKSKDSLSPEHLCLGPARFHTMLKF